MIIFWYNFSHNSKSLRNVVLNFVPDRLLKMYYTCKKDNRINIVIFIFETISAITLIEKFELIISLLFF